MKASNFTLNSVHIALFSSKPGDFSPAVILGSILNKYQARYNGEIQALPIPAEAPVEIPRVILLSSDGSYRIEAGPIRIDSHWQRTNETKVDLAEYSKKAFEPLETLIRERQLSIGRCAFVVTRTYDDPQAADHLADKFCKSDLREGKGPLRRSDFFELHNHKKYSITFSGNKQQEVNSWIRCKAVQAAKDQRKMILVEQDLNTPQEDLPRKLFTADEIVSFVDMAIKEVDKTLELYFP